MRGGSSAPADRVPELVQRKTESEMNDHEKELAKIQGWPMYSLLPSLAKLPDEVKTDFTAGRSIGGPRLVAAMKAVTSGADWMAYANANHGDMGTLPPDQIRDIMGFLGAPKDARYYKDIPGKSHGRFDGAVDPASQVITLFFRAKLVVGGAEQQVAHAVTQQALEAFKPRFKAEIEKVWSGGHIKPAAAIAGVSGFTTKTNVALVDDGEHLVFYVVPDELGPSNVNKERGQLRESANEEKQETCPLYDDPSGKTRHEVTNTQTGSAHEFGHAIGLDHPRPDASRPDDKCNPEYGKTVEERGDIMGTGHELRVIKRAGVDHNDFGPFVSIGEKWGAEILPGALASHNKWSVG